MTNGVITQIQPFSVHDGPGIRTMVFLKSCQMRCPWCHNPETYRRHPEIQVFPERCLGCRACAAACQHAAHEFIDTAHRLKSTCNLTIRVHDGLDPRLLRKGVGYLLVDRKAWPRFSGDKALVEGFMRNGYVVKSAHVDIGLHDSQHKQRLMTVIQDGRRTK